MEVENKVEAKTARESRAAKCGRRYTFEERLKAVRLHLQEGFPQKLVCAESCLLPLQEIARRLKTALRRARAEIGVSNAWPTCKCVIVVSDDLEVGQCGGGSDPSIVFAHSAAGFSGPALH